RDASDQPSLTHLLLLHCPGGALCAAHMRHTSPAVAVGQILATTDEKSQTRRLGPRPTKRGPLGATRAFCRRRGSSSLLRSNWRRRPERDRRRASTSCTLRE